MLEITPDNAAQYLRQKGFVPLGEPIQVTPLGGGISNIVMLVRWPGDGFVFKQSLPKLRVKDDWPFNRNRISATLQLLNCAYRIDGSTLGEIFCLVNLKTNKLQ